MTYIARTIDVTKVYEGVEVVSNVNMSIKQGEIYGFLGPNGAGKTTIMKMLTNLVKPTTGEIELFGEKLTPTSYEVLKRMGSIIEYPFSMISCLLARIWSFTVNTWDFTTKRSSTTRWKR